MTCDVVFVKARMSSLAIKEEEICMSELSKMRNIGISAHIDSGKLPFPSVFSFIQIEFMRSTKFVEKMALVLRWILWNLREKEE